MGGCQSSAPTEAADPSNDADDVTVSVLSGFTSRDAAMAWHGSLWDGRESLIADCMRRQGFDYEPQPLTQEYFDSLPPAVWDLQPDRDYVSQNGWGLAEALNLETEDDEPPPDEGESVPNSEQYDSGYRAALYGGGDTRGCYSKGQAVISAAQAVSPEDMSTLWEIREELWASPAWIGLDDRWARCMADAGYPGFRTKNDPFDALDAEIEGSPPPSNHREAQEAYDTFLRKELELATASFDCDEPLQAERHRLLSEAEAEYYRAHRSELDALALRREDGVLGASELEELIAAATESP